MRIFRVVMRERCDSLAALTRRRTFYLRGQVCPVFPRAARLMAAYGFLVALTATRAFAAQACCSHGTCTPSVSAGQCVGGMGGRVVGGCAGDSDSNGIDDACEVGGPTFNGCGVLIAGAETGCVLFRADAGGEYLLDNYGIFIVGDRVRVVGFLNPNCITTCQQGPCIENNTIGVCPGVPAVSEWGLGALALLLLSGVAIKFGRRREAALHPRRTPISQSFHILIVVASLSSILSATTAQAAGTFVGSATTLEGFYPNLSSPPYLTLGPATVVHPGVEFPQILIGFPSGNPVWSADVATATIVFNHLNAGVNDLGCGGPGQNPFNGFVFTFSGLTEPIASVALNSSSTLIPFNFWATGNQVFLDYQCLGVIPNNSSTILDVTFVKPIPTVSAWGLVILTSLLLTGIAIKFGRRRATA